MLLLFFYLFVSQEVTIRKKITITDFTVCTTNTFVTVFTCRTARLPTGLEDFYILPTAGGFGWFFKTTSVRVVVQQCRT